MRILWVVLFVLGVGNFSFCQEDYIDETLYDRHPIDTIQTDDGEVVFFSDKSWEYLDLLDFDGITNPYLFSLISEDTSIHLKQKWVNHITIPYPNNPVNEIQDTIWLCVTDSINSDFCMPFDGRVTSTFKYRGRRFHHGLDIDLETGDTVKAAFDGIIRYAKFNTGGFGNLVIIRHYNGLETYYAHLSKLAVVPNQKVKAGEPIGLGGNTGRSFGSHLHFEVRFFDHAIDPEAIIDFENKRVRDANLFVTKELFNYKSFSSSSSSSSRSSSSSSSTVNKNSSYHKIRSGDSLYELSLKYGVSMNQICKLNNISVNTVLQIGQVLKLR